MAAVPSQLPRLLLAPFATADRTQQVAVRGRPTGVLLLSDKNVAHNRLLCAAPDADVSPPDHPRDVKLYILGKRKSSTEAESCDEILANYDYYRAEKDFAQFGLETTVGPVLIEYSGIRSKDLVWDLSKFADADVPRALTIWQHNIAPDSNIWKQGWRVPVVDATVSNMFQTLYGEQLAANQLPLALERKPILGGSQPARAEVKSRHAKIEKLSAHRSERSPIKPLTNSKVAPQKLRPDAHGSLDPPNRTRSGSLGGGAGVRIAQD